jgi:hypothetical protein
MRQHTAQDQRNQMLASERRAERERECDCAPTGAQTVRHAAQLERLARLRRRRCLVGISIAVGVRRRRLKQIDRCTVTLLKRNPINQLYATTGCWTIKRRTLSLLWWSDCCCLARD